MFVTLTGVLISGYLPPLLALQPPMGVVFYNRLVGFSLLA